MTPEAQRIAIAVACGWTTITDASLTDGLPSFYGFPPNSKLEKPLPDYLKDLNAMHEVVEFAKISDVRWSTALMNVIRDDPSWTAGAVEARYRTAKATAAQRAEALLKTIGKWDDKP